MKTSLDFLLLFADFDKNCCKKDCPCAKTPAEKKEVSKSDFEVLASMIKKNKKFKNSNLKISKKLKTRKQKKVEKLFEKFVKKLNKIVQN